MPRSLEQWLAYQAQLHPQAIDLGLDRLREVLRRLHWRQPDVPVITVAGTNGKGSVSAYCAAIMGAAGYRVGTFTSPHLRDYRERIRIHDRLVAPEELVSAFERIEAARGEVGLTFFEFNALAALLVFEAAGLDAWVLEIGMGGRLDAVNVVDPDAAVVVSIGFDHQEYLGTTLEAIAREKAGIFRPGRPAILGSREMPGIVERIARDMGAPLKRLGVEFSYAVEGAGWHYRGSVWDLPHLPAPALAGGAQFGNAATAIAALEEIADSGEEVAASGGKEARSEIGEAGRLHAGPQAAGAGGKNARLTVSASAVAQGLISVRLVARFQLIAPVSPMAPTWILDVAHNPAAARVLAENLRATRGGRQGRNSGGRPDEGVGPGGRAVKESAGRTLAVCGILADKDAAGIAAQLRDCIDAWWCASTDGARGQSGVELAEKVRTEVTAPVEAMDSLAAACTAASSAAMAGDRIVVFGSFHTVGPALDWLEARDLLPPDSLPEYTAAPRAT